MLMLLLKPPFTSLAVLAFGCAVAFGGERNKSGQQSRMKRRTLAAGIRTVVPASNRLSLSSSNGILGILASGGKTFAAHPPIMIARCGERRFIPKEVYC